MKQKIFTLEDMNITVKLHISPDDYPKTLKPDDSDFFIHIDSKDSDFTERTINSLDDAAELIKSKVNKNPEAQQQYKFKIKKYGVYIRDEAKDTIELDFLYDVILSLVDEVQNYIDNDLSTENDDSENEYSEDDYQEEKKINESNENTLRSNEIDLEEDYNKNHNKEQSNIDKKENNEEKSISKNDDSRRTSMKISKLSLNDSQSEEDGENVLKLLLSETNQEKK